MTDLLARRRLETTETIHRAALDLFERQGVRGTTVPQIAEQAGVSPRTFFRYFRAKEDAAIPGQHRLFEAVDALDLTGLVPAQILTAIAGATEEVILGELDPSLVGHRRIAQLMAREPELQWHAAARDREFVEHIAARVSAAAPQVDALTVALLAELAATLWRVTWERWGARTEDAGSLTPAEVFARLRAALPELV
ncbi:MAG: TetR family transcriptional regulator [Microbacterium sp.]|uniref:TetR family transcriptional regulator n=1 Tax=Microbacterium sp. TaxID=51671 RepID=UPI0039E29A91